MITRFRKGQCEPKQFVAGLIIGSVLGIVVGMTVIGLFF